MCSDVEGKLSSEVDFNPSAAVDVDSRHFGRSSLRGGRRSMSWYIKKGGGNQDFLYAIASMDYFSVFYSWTCQYQFRLRPHEVGKFTENRQEIVSFISIRKNKTKKQKMYFFHFFFICSLYT